MKKVFKYQLQHIPSQMCVLPKGAEIICVDLRGGIPYIWALIDDSLHLEQREIRIHKTGEEIPGVVGPYIGTFMMNGEINHVFDGAK